LALQDFVSNRGHFPPAYEATDLDPGWSWGAMLLPFLEQVPLYQDAGVDVHRFGGGSNPAVPNAFTQTLLPIFRCTPDTGPDLNDFRLLFATSNYRAITGPFPFLWPDLDMGGVMYQNSKTKIVDITDGTSNTLVVGECILDEARGKWAALWSGMTGTRNGSTYISDVMWWLDNGDSAINGPAPQAFSSRHGGGAYFAFCDGSVRFIFEGGDVNSVRWLAGRDDGNMVTLDE
jgi:prepilin-type processing-associated H-X9-DG protein